MPHIMEAEVRAAEIKAAEAEERKKAAAENQLQQQPDAAAAAAAAGIDPSTTPTTLLAMAKDPNTDPETARTASRLAKLAQGGAGKAGGEEDRADAWRADKWIDR